MTDSGETCNNTPETPLDTANSPAVSREEEAEWVRLRSLLFANEIAALGKIRERLDNPDMHARDVSKVIAEALLLRSGKDERLQAALQATVENIVKDSVRRNPSDFAGRIFPVIGPAIRQAISESFRAMLLGFNKSLEMSLSWKGLRWRIEALRTGKPFSEIVLLHTLLYRVEQIFLIHAETGLVLDHLVSDGVETQDADLVSGMLTAVQDFIRDCFISGEQESSTLDNLQLGDHTIFVERSSQIYLAYVVRGTPPPSLRENFREALEVIALECADLLEKFNGDTNGFQTIRRHLEGFLISRFIDDGKKFPFLTRALAISMLLLFLGGAGFLYWHLSNQNEAFTLAIAALDNEPGVTVTSVIPSSFGTWEISAFKDELAKDITPILVSAGMPENRFLLRVIPYTSLDDNILLRRIEKMIDPPQMVQIRLDGDHILHLSGVAPQDWIETAQGKIQVLPGIEKIDSSELSDPRSQQFNTALALLNNEPGIVVTQVVKSSSTPWEISCLWDELAPKPSALLAAAGIPEGLFSLHVSPYISLDESIIRKRVRAAIQPPDTVQVIFDENRVLHLSGTASMGWILATREKALTIAGIKDIDTSKLNDPRTEKMTRLVRSIESVNVHFPPNKDTPIPEDQPTLSKAVDDLVQLEKLAREMGIAISLTIYGHADATGQDKRNYEISQERAKTLAAMLYARGSSIPISTYGMGAEYASHSDGKSQPDQASRKIELKVNLSRAGVVTPGILQE